MHPSGMSEIGVLGVVMVVASVSAAELVARGGSPLQLNDGG